MIAAQEPIQYFNTEYPCKLFVDAHGPCKNFDITGCQESCFNADNSKKEEGVININRDSDLNVDLNEINYGNRLQTYYKYVTTKPLPAEVTFGLNPNFDIRPNQLQPESLLPESLLTKTPVYLQKTDMIKETMLFIFLDQGHDFHVAGERGNTMWTGVKKASTTMVYRSPINHERVEDEDEEIPAGKSEFDDEDESNPSINPSQSSVTLEDEEKYTQTLDISLDNLASNLGVQVTPPGEIVIPYPYKNEYRNFAINTSFSGDIGIFGVMYMSTSTNTFLKTRYQKGTDIDINAVLNAMNITYHIELNSAYGCIIQIKNGGGDSGITHNFRTLEAMMNVTFLPFVGGSIYNNGMHSIWDFNQERCVYLITLDKLTIKNSTSLEVPSYITTAEYGGKFFFETKLNIPVQEVDLNLITGELTNTNVKSQQQIAEKEKRYKKFEDILLGGNTSPVRGTKYQLSNLPDKALVLEFVFKELIQPFFSKYSPIIHPEFRCLSVPNNEENTKLNSMIIAKSIVAEEQPHVEPPSVEQPPSSSNIEKHFFKQIGFVNDTAVVPSDNHYCKAFNSTNNTDYPYKFSVVSGPVDGSGQGGQITPEYHPPELDVYMVVFNPQKSDETGSIGGGELMGIIARLTFTKKIYSNTLNSKNNSLVELHYVYIDVKFLTEAERGDLNLLDVGQYPIIIEKLLNFALLNTVINGDGMSNLKLTLSTGEERLWFKYIIETVGPSVASLNSKIIQLTKTLKFINDIKRNKPENDEIVDFLVKMENRDNTNKLLSFVLGDELPIIDTILRVAQNLYNTTPELHMYFEPDITNYPIDDPIDDPNDAEAVSYTRNLTFERVFIIRNKYIGDKSRSTDCLFMNKSKYLECMQLSNDTNTLYTAQMYGLSTLWSTGGRKPIIYMAPYLNSHNAVPILTNGFQQALKDGMSSTSSNKSIKVIGFKEKTSDVDIELIINTPRVRKSTSPGSRDASPVSISRVDELEKYTLSGKKQRVNTLKSKLSETLKAQTSRAKSIKKSPLVAVEGPVAAEAEAAVAAVEASKKSAPDKVKKDKLLVSRPKKGGAIINSPGSEYSLFTSSVRSKTNDPYSSTSLLELKQPEKSVELENIKVAQAPPQITSSIETSDADYRKNYTEGYRNNLIYVLQNNLRIIKSVHEKYDILLSNNNLNVAQITDDNKFFIATNLLQIKRILIDLNTPYELLIEILEKVDADTTIEQSINIKNMFSRIFDEYNTTNNIGLYGIEYYFNIPQEMEVQVDTTVQVGGLRRYDIKFFYSWQNNNNFILNRFKRFINLYRHLEPDLEENIRKQIEIAENIYKYLSSISLDDLEEIEKSFIGREEYKKFIDTYKFISFFYIIFCNNIKNLIKEKYGIITDNPQKKIAEVLAEGAAPTLQEQLTISDGKDTLDLSDEDLSDEDLIRKEPDITRLRYIPDDYFKVTQNIILSFYTSEDIITFLAGNSKAIPIEFKFIIEIGNLSIILSTSGINIRDILSYLFEICIREIYEKTKNPVKITNSDIKSRLEVELNGLLFLLYLFYPNELEEKLILYKITFINEHPITLRGIDLNTKITDSEKRKIFINYFQYLFNFIEQILLYTEIDDINYQTVYSRDLIFNVTSQLYEKEEEEVKEEVKEPGKGGKKLRSLKNKISKKIHKTKNNKKLTNKKLTNKKLTNKKLTRKQTLIKISKKSKRNNK